MRAEGFTDPAFAQLADLAHLLAGLSFPPNRQPSAEAGMRRAMATLRIADPVALLRSAQLPGDARDVVLAELTVGESYFFRDAPQFGVLAGDILLRRATTPTPRRLNIWSAGCASGEEPYTIAIMLRELGWRHSAHILGTDVALPRLAAARRGCYTRWALRGVSEDRVTRWFRRNDNSFCLDPSVRDAVEFRALNLLHDAYPSQETGGEGYDLVVCRNVMIYFDMPTVTHIAAGLLQALAPDGWLILGASDPPLGSLVPCRAVQTAGGIAYQRPGRSLAVFDVGYAPRADLNLPVPAASPAPVRAPEPESIPVFPPAIALQVERTKQEVDPRRLERLKEVASAYGRADYPAAEFLAMAALTNDVDVSDARGSADDADMLTLWTVYIRAVANQGRLHDAGTICARALEVHPLAAELHHLHATLLLEAGWHTDAVIAARRAIYLDRTLVMGHLLLGDALARAGDRPGARRAFENVVALLANTDPAVPVVAADGIPPLRLRQVATLRLRELALATSR